MIKRDTYTYNCNLTPLTPIQIGKGNQIYPYDYVIKDGYYYRIEVSEILSKMPEDKVKMFTKLLENNDIIKIRSFISNNYEEKYGYEYKCEVTPEVQKKYFDKIGGAIKSNENNQLIVEEFVGSFKGKYIPGSTIKGAIRGAFLFAEFNKNIHGYKIRREDKTRSGKPNKTAPFRFVDEYNRLQEKPKKDSDKIEASILGLTKLEPKFDPFKYFSVTDTEVTNDLVKIASIKRVSEKDNTPDMTMGDYEVSKSILGDKGKTTELKFDISIRNNQIPDDILEQISTEKNSDRSIVKETIGLYLDIIFQNLNDKARLMIQSDKEFFEKANNRNGIIACDKLNEYLENLKENEALIRMGRGAGFNSTTFNLANSKEKVFTRVLIGDYPAGWAIITCTNYDF